MAAATVRTAGTSDEERVIAVVTLAFGTDPPSRWMYADPREYMTNFPSFVRAFGGEAFRHGTADYVDGFAGAALWLPPGAHPDDDALVLLVQRTVAEPLRTDLMALFERMGNNHPREPHWYLPLIGVDPLQQSSGHGSTLLRHGLARCARDHLTAYVESTNPRNVPLYERHGFAVVGTIQVGGSPPIIPMLRKPAPARP